MIPYKMPVVNDNFLKMKKKKPIVKPKVASYYPVLYKLTSDPIKNASQVRNVQMTMLLNKLVDELDLKEQEWINNRTSHTSKKKQGEEIKILSDRIAKTIKETQNTQVQTDLQQAGQEFEAFRSSRIPQTYTPVEISTPAPIPNLSNVLQNQGTNTEEPKTTSKTASTQTEPLADSVLFVPAFPDIDEVEQTLNETPADAVFRLYVPSNKSVKIDKETAKTLFNQGYTFDTNNFFLIEGRFLDNYMYEVYQAVNPQENPFTTSPPLPPSLPSAQRLTDYVSSERIPESPTFQTTLDELRQEASLYDTLMDTSKNNLERELFDQDVEYARNLPLPSDLENELFEEQGGAPAILTNQLSDLIDTSKQYEISNDFDDKSRQVQVGDNPRYFEHNRIFVSGKTSNTDNLEKFKEFVKLRNNDVEFYRDSYVFRPDGSKIQYKSLKSNIITTKNIPIVAYILNNPRKLIFKEVDPFSFDIRPEMKEVRLGTFFV